MFLLFYFNLRLIIIELLNMHIGTLLKFLIFICRIVHNKFWINYHWICIIIEQVRLACSNNRQVCRPSLQVIISRRHVWCWMWNWEWRWRNWLRHIFIVCTCLLLWGSIWIVSAATIAMINRIDLCKLIVIMDPQILTLKSRIYEFNILTIRLVFISNHSA